LFRDYLDANNDLIVGWVNHTPNNTILDIQQKYNVKLVYDQARFPIVIPTDFVQESEKFLISNPDQMSVDAYFNEHTRLWGLYMQAGMYDNAEAVWRIALKIARDCVKGGYDIHRGTPFYFYSVTAIISGQLDKGYILMHRAIEEDKKTFGINYKSQAAYAFVTLDYANVNQFFKPEVEDLQKYLGAVISEYNKAGYDQFTINEFKKKFLEIDGNLQDTIFTFVYILSRLKQLANDYLLELTPTDFSSLFCLQILSDLCLTLDSTLEHLYKWPACNFSDRITKLSIHVSGGPKPNPGLELNLNGKIGQINGSFKTNFSKTLIDFIDGNYLYQDGTKPTFIEKDFAIAYGVRNYSAHNLSHQTVVHTKFFETSQSILNALIFSITRS